MLRTTIYYCTRIDMYVFVNLGRGCPIIDRYLAGRFLLLPPPLAPPLLQHLKGNRHREARPTDATERGHTRGQ